MAKLISFPRYEYDGKRHLEIRGTTATWLFKQILPLTYHGVYTSVDDGGERLDVFRMWLGRVRSCKTYKLTA